MAETTPLQDLVRATVALVLDPASDAAGRREALQRLHDAQAPLTGIPPYVHGDPFWTNTAARHGMMIAPGYAVGSLLDEAVTTAIWREVDAEVQARLARGERCSILLAQPGPLGALVLPLLHRYPAGTVDVTLVDMWSGTLAALQNTIQALGVGEWVVAQEHADPCFYRTDRRFDVVVVLMAQRGLGTQPQLAAMLNLAPLLKPDGALVPASFALRLFYLNLEDELGVVGGRIAKLRQAPALHRREPIAALVHIDRSWLEARLGDSPGWRQAGFWLGEVDVPRRLRDDECLAFDVEPGFVHGPRVGPWQSGITAAELVRSLPDFDGPGRLKVGFNTGSEPGVRLVVLAPSS